MPNYSGYDGQLDKTSIIMCYEYLIDALIDWSKSFFIIKLNSRLHRYIHAAIYKVNLKAILLNNFFQVFQEHRPEKSVVSKVFQAKS